MNNGLNYLLEELAVFLARGGWVLWPIFAVGQIGWILLFERWLRLRAWTSDTERFWKAAPAEKNALLVYLKNQKQRGLLPEITRFIAQSQTNEEKAMNYRAREWLEDKMPMLHRHFNSIGVLTAAAPLLGLLGTLSGMTATFNMIALYGAGNPVLMASGISEALITTEAGLVVAFPMVLFHNFLSNRAEAIENACISGAVRVINLTKSSGESV